jgi:hypothetical protein
MTKPQSERNAMEMTAVVDGSGTALLIDRPTRSPTIYVNDRTTAA